MIAHVFKDVVHAEEERESGVAKRRERVRESEGWCGKKERRGKVGVGKEEREGWCGERRERGKEREGWSGEKEGMREKVECGKRRERGSRGR